MTEGKEPDFTPHHWLPTRSEMCAQVGTIVLGSYSLFQNMPGTYGENWYTLLDMLQQQRVELEELRERYDDERPETTSDKVRGWDKA